MVVIGKAVIFCNIGEAVFICNKVVVLVFVMGKAVVGIDGSRCNVGVIGEVMVIVVGKLVVTVLGKAVVVVRFVDKVMLIVVAIGEVVFVVLVAS